MSQHRGMGTRRWTRSGRWCPHRRPRKSQSMAPPSRPGHGAARARPRSTIAPASRCGGGSVSCARAPGRSLGGPDRGSRRRKTATRKHGEAGCGDRKEQPSQASRPFRRPAANHDHGSLSVGVVDRGPASGAPDLPFRAVSLPCVSATNRLGHSFRSCPLHPRAVHAGTTNATAAAQANWPIQVFIGIPTS